MDRLLTPEFWATQVSLVMSAPYVIVPLLLLAAIIIGWTIKEIRRCRARRDAAETRLQQAQDRHQAVRENLAHLQFLIVQMSEKIKKLKAETAAAPGRSPILDEITNDSAKAKFSIVNLLHASHELRRILTPES
jgi:predicted membrane-bound mannosyltransferase